MIALFVITIFTISFVSSLCLLWIIKKYACRWGLKDVPNARKMHDHVMPRGGGIGIFVSMLLAYGAGWLLAYYCNTQFGVLDSYIDEHPLFWKEVSIILLGATIIFMTGLCDDFFNLRPWTKLLLESCVAWLLILNEIRITLFIENYLFSVLVTWAWVILITNSFNLLDNMDGLSAGICIIASSVILIVAFQTQQYISAFLIIAILGSLIGFLFYNFHPASIFMGDSGSLTIGYMMATLTIYTTFAKETAFPVAMPIIILAVPLFDTFTVIILRIRAGCSIFQADKRHFSHRLLHLGFTPVQSVGLIYLLTCVTSCDALLLYHLTFIGIIIVLFQLIGTLLIIHILEQVGNHNHDN